MTYAATTVVDDGQYRWSADTDTLARAMVRLGYRSERRDAVTYIADWTGPCADEADDLGAGDGDAYSLLCSEVGYTALSSDGAEAQAAIDAALDAGAETMVPPVGGSGWDVSAGLHAALVRAEETEAEAIA